MTKRVRRSAKTGSPRFRKPVRARRKRAKLQQSLAPYGFALRSEIRPTVVFDTFWRFAAERQRIFFARTEGRRPPWTEDPILREYKFTNAYRASDRVSQYLIRNVIYKGADDPDEVFFRTILFKLFNKIETWQLLETQLGTLRFSSFRYPDYDRVLSKALASGHTIYSAAYIMASGNSLFSVKRKHQAHLKLLELMMKDSVPSRLMECKSMRGGFDLLRSYPLIGDFLAYQLITDINYSELTKFSEMEFTMPGPGASDGIRKCFNTIGGLSEADVIRLAAENQNEEFRRRKLDFRTLWGRPLQLIDIQNLFCEVGKYSRAKHPTFVGLSGRMRIKQKYRECKQEIIYYYPPKWSLNVKSTKGSPPDGEYQQALF